MRIPRIFTDQALVESTTIELARESSHYLSRVLRLPLEAPIRVFNGLGGEYQAHICNIDKHCVSLKIASFDSSDNSSPLHIHLGIALSKGERMGLVIQKATELGVTEISLLNSERTEVKLKGERLQKRLSHWRKVAISACEQCGCNRIPVINPPVSLQDWTNKRDEEIKLIMQPGTTQQFQQAKPAAVALLIGPEGGFAEQEVSSANQNGFASITLGPRILRTETAPLVAISLLQHHWGDLN